MTARKATARFRSPGYGHSGSYEVLAEIPGHVRLEGIGWRSLHVLEITGGGWR